MNHTKIVIEDEVDEMCSIAQVKFIDSLMMRNEEHARMYLDKLCYRIHHRLSKQQACKLIDCLLKFKKFEIVEEL